MATIQGVYLALFGRPADPAGLAYFEDVTNDGADLTAIGDLASTPEYQTRFDGITNSQIVTSIYQSLFGRNPELAGLNYFVAELASGRQSINTIAINILDGAQGDDATTVANKLTAAAAFTAAIDQPDELAAYNGDDAADLGRAFLQPITSDDATIPTADETAAAVQGVVDAAPPSGPVGGTFSLTPGNDYADNTGSIKNGGLQDSTFAFTTRNDTVIANTATIGGTDTLLDSATTDHDVIKYTGGTVTALSNFVQVQNIEELNVSLTAATNSAANLSVYTGLQSVVATGSIDAGDTIQFNNFAASGVSSFNSTAVTGGVNSIFYVNDGAANQDITVTGGAVDHIITLGNGDDTITTGAGDDFITLGGGDNVIKAGDGDNSVSVTSGDNDITVGAGDDLVTIGNGANTVVLGDGTNTLNGGGNGNNTITGGADVDTLTLGNGTNTITTGDGNDSITVGTGGNTITAGEGADTVTLGGGTAASTLTIGADDTGITAATIDTIAGFTTTVDKIDFNLAAGTAANYIELAGGATFGTSQALADAALDGVNNLYAFTYNAAGGYLFVDSDHDGTSDYAVALTGGATAAFFDQGDIIA